MEITDVTVTPISCPFERNVAGSGYEKGQRETIVVTVRTDDGVTGRTYSGDFGDVGERGRRKVVEFLREDLRPIVVGEELFHIERLWESMFDRASRFPAWKSDLQWFFVNAIGALDTALWDTIGKAVDRPLYELWGGYRDSVPIIGIGGYYEEGKDITDLVNEMEEFKERGLAGVKMKVGKAPIERDLQRVRAVRNALGEEFVIACDANQAWTVKEAVDFATGAEALDVRWLEEPVEWHDQYQGMRAVRGQTTIPVCAGQSEITTAACRRLVEGESIDILNFDASWGGGPTAWRKVAAMADLYDIQLAHHEEPHLAMHLLASIPNGLFVECFHPDIDPVWYEMVANRPPANDGRIHLPNDPGLGLKLDTDFIDQYRIDNS